MIPALAFLAGVVVGACGIVAIACCVHASRCSRLEKRWRPMDDLAPWERPR